MKRETIFIIVGIFLLLSVISLFIYLISFLIKNINTVLSPDLSKNQEIIRFNLEGLEKLGIRK